MAEAAGSSSQALILAKYLVFPVIPAGIKLKSSPKKHSQETASQVAKETRHPACSDAWLPSQGPWGRSGREQSLLHTAQQALTPPTSVPPVRCGLVSLESTTWSNDSLSGRLTEAAGVRAGSNLTWWRSQRLCWASGDHGHWWQRGGSSLAARSRGTRAPEPDSTVSRVTITCHLLGLSSPIWKTK